MVIHDWMISGGTPMTEENSIWWFIYSLVHCTIMKPWRNPALASNWSHTRQGAGGKGKWQGQGPIYGAGWCQTVCRWLEQCHSVFTIISPRKDSHRLGKHPSFGWNIFCSWPAVCCLRTAKVSSPLVMLDRPQQGRIFCERGGSSKGLVMVGPLFHW